MSLSRWILLTFAFLSAPMTFSMEIYDTEDAGFAYIMADGEIVPRDARTLKLRLSKYGKDEFASAILFSSPGGVLEATPTIAEVIISESNKLYQTTGKANIFVINNECSSACTVLTTILTQKRDPRALKIWVTPNSTFGFHSPVEKTGNSVKQIEDIGEREEKIRKQLRYYENNGISTVWLQNNENIFKQSEMTDYTAHQLCSDRALVIPPDSCLPTDGDVIPLIQEVLRDENYVKESAKAQTGKPSKSPARRPKPKATQESIDSAPGTNPLFNFFKRMLGS